jgi:hypothetical protein
MAPPLTARQKAAQEVRNARNSNASASTVAGPSARQTPRRRGCALNIEGIHNPFHRPVSNEELERSSIQAQIDHEVAVHARQLEYDDAIPTQ